MEIPNHGLKRELKLRDLVSMQVVLIVWLGWTGFAAKQGSTQVVLWLLAIILFYLPLAAVVMKLSRAMPAEGGSYQWIKAGVSPFAGYMAAWNLTIYSISAFAVVGSILANGFAYAVGPKGSWMLTSKPFALTITAVCCLVAVFVNVRGLQVGKWLSVASSILTMAIFLVLLGLLIRAWAIAMPSVHGSLSLAWPGLSIVTLNVFSKMGVGALGGFDSSAVFSEECRKPENDVARSVLIAAPLIALMYILGTSATLAYIAPANVDLAASVPQVMQAALGVTGLGRALGASVSIAFNLAFATSMIIYMGLLARLPMVAGWDGLLPDWWSTLHPKYRTPAKAIIAVAAVMMVLGVLSLLGAGNQEALQVGVGAGIGCLCIMYMLLFSVVVFGGRSRFERMGIGIRLGALAAFLVAFVSLIFEIVPLGDVADSKLFAVKVIGTILAANCLGGYLYWRGTQRLKETSQA